MDRLLAHYAVSAADATADVEAFLAQMQGRNLLDTVTP